MSNSSENIGKNSNKITVLNISGKKKDREQFKDSLDYSSYLVRDNTIKDFSNSSTRQIIRKIKAWNNIFTLYFPVVMIFENLNPIVIQNIGDELDNMIIDIHLNKVNKCIKDEQIKSCLELLEKL